MKLATLNNGTRDGALVLVTKDMTKMAFASDQKVSMQNVIDEWEHWREPLEERLDLLNAGKIPNIMDYDATKLLAPLPRAYQWLDGSAYVHHVELARKSRGAEMPDSFWSDPLMYQGASDFFYPGKSDFVLDDPKFGLDFEAEIFVITKKIEQGGSLDDAILFVGLLNDWSYRNLIASELSKGFGFVQSKPHCALAPVVVTVDELGDNWRDFRLHLPVKCTLNDVVVGEPNAGIDMIFNFKQLIAHAALGRSLAGGSLVGAGTVSNKDLISGSACLVEKRMIEKISKGSVETEYLKIGDSLTIEVAFKGESVFGKIENKIISRKS